jgi:hypothetical protein
MVSAGKYYLLARATAAARVHSMAWHTYTLGAKTWRPGVSFFIFIPGPRVQFAAQQMAQIALFIVYSALCRPSLRPSARAHNMCRLFMRAPTARFRTLGAWEIENHFSLPKSAWGLLLKRVPPTFTQPFKRFPNNGHHVH